MQHKVGIELSTKRKIADQVFSMLASKNEIEFDLNSLKIVEQWNKSYPTLIAYLDVRFF